MKKVSMALVFAWVTVASSLFLMVGLDRAEALPRDWTFTGYAEVQDPLGDPIANAPIFMEGSTRYNFRQERDPDTGQVYWAWIQPFAGRVLGKNLSTQVHPGQSQNPVRYIDPPTELFPR